MLKGRVKKSIALLSLIALTFQPVVFAESSIQEGQAPSHIIENGVTQPQFSYEDAIRETVYIQTSLDTNNDGIPDRIAADIIRPAETEEGIEVPVIMIASPYYDNLGRGNEGQLKVYDEEGTPVQFPLYYDNYFVPRGYAVVQVDMVGTNKSDGCPRTGGPEETEGVVAVIDWLNGRAEATNASGEEVNADWSTGKVGMYGKSYDGTLANAAAATGVDGLETIVPVVAISSWYDYYRSHGVVYSGISSVSNLANTVSGNAARRAECAPVRAELLEGADNATGNYNDFWDERNYVKDADKVKASVFVIHGLNDLNVKTRNFSQWWDKLVENDVPRKIWLTQTAHTEPFDFRRDEWVSTIHRWFDYWLLGIENGIMDEPMADVEHTANEWTSYSSWPDVGTQNVTLRLGNSDDEIPGFITSGPVQGNSTMTFNNNSLTQAQAVTQELTQRDDRLVFLSPVLTEEVRLSGTPQIDIRGKVNGQEANLTAYIVDYGRDERVNHASSSGLLATSNIDCIGDSTSQDSACYRSSLIRTHTTDYEVVSRAWMDMTNYKSLFENDLLRVDKNYHFRTDGLAHDYVFKPGHRIGIVVTSSVRTHVAANPNSAEIEIYLGQSKIILPVVGGKKVLDF